MKKVKVTFKGNVVKTFDLQRIDILPIMGNDMGHSMLHLNRRGDNKYVLSCTQDIIPDVTFLDKIEIVEE
jgi:hypothetical protein